MLRVDQPSQMIRLDIGAGMAERDDTFFEIVGEGRNPHQIAG